MLNRRAMVALAGAMLPWTVRGQPSDAPGPSPSQMPSVIPPQATPATTTPATTTPAATQPAVPDIRPRSQLSPRPAATGAVDKSKTYFVFFDQTIDVASIRLLRRQLSTLVEAGVSEIDLVISSPGGLVFQALAAYSLIRALPATVTTHATGMVSSAANVVFLAGDNRSADRNARFFFHADQGTMPGSVSALQLENRLAQFSALQAIETQVYHDRTQLPDDQIARFQQEEVLYTPDQAKTFGIIQTIADLRIPGGDTSRLVFVE